MNLLLLLIYHGFCFTIKANDTLQGELNQVYEHFCSFDIIYESPAGPDHYLTLVHALYKASDYVGVLE